MFTDHWPQFDNFSFDKLDFSVNLLKIIKISMKSKLLLKLSSCLGVNAQEF